MNRRTWGLLIASLLVAGVLSLFASSHPDGLERVLEDLNITAESTISYAAPLPDYQVPAVESPVLSGSLAGIIGMLMTLGAAWGAFWLLTGTRRARSHGS